MPKLVDMAKTKAEMKAEQEKYKSSPCGIDDPYGYGLRVRLDQGQLKKLGLKPSGFNVGDTVTITARCEVSSVSQDNTKTHDRSNVELQIEALSLTMGEDMSAEDAVSRAISKAGK